MSEDVTLYQADDIIRTIRGQRVIIDSNYRIAAKAKRRVQ